MHIKYTKIQPKNNKKIKILKTNQRKKNEQTSEFKCNINVKAMTSGVHQKSSALNLLVSIKYFRVPNNRPPPIVNFSIFSHPGHPCSYFSSNYYTNFYVYI